MKKILLALVLGGWLAQQTLSGGMVCIWHDLDGDYSTAEVAITYIIQSTNDGVRMIEYERTTDPEILKRVEYPLVKGE